MSRLLPRRIHTLGLPDGKTMRIVGGYAAWADEDGLDTETIRDLVGTILIAGDYISIDVDDAGNTITINVDIDTLSTYLLGLIPPPTGELVIADGTSPPEFVMNEDETDYVYGG